MKSFFFFFLLETKRAWRICRKLTGHGKQSRLPRAMPAVESRFSMGDVSEPAVQCIGATQGDEQESRDAMKPIPAHVTWARVARSEPWTGSTWATTRGRLLEPAGTLFTALPPTEWTSSHAVDFCFRPFRRFIRLLLLLLMRRAVG